MENQNQTILNEEELRFDFEKVRRLDLLGITIEIENRMPGFQSKDDILQEMRIIREFVEKYKKILPKANASELLEAPELDSFVLSDVLSNDIHN